MKIAKFLHQVAICKQKYRRVLIFFYCHNSFAAKLELTFLWTVSIKKLSKRKAFLLFIGNQNTIYYFYFYYPKFIVILKNTKKKFNYKVG
jgi:hypothetical protein